MQVGNVLHAARSYSLRVAPMCIPSSTPQSVSAPYRCCPLLSRFRYIDRQTCPSIFWAGRFLPLKLPLLMGDPDSHLIRGSFGPRESSPKGHLNRFSRFCRAHDRDRPTDRPRYSVCSNSAAVRLNNKYFVSGILSTFVHTVALLYMSTVNEHNKHIHSSVRLTHFRLSFTSIPCSSVLNIGPRQNT